MASNNLMRKYRNVKTFKHGRWFDSMLECRKADLLLLRETKGLIRDLEFQPKVYLTAARILYKPDFKFYDLERNKIIYIDAKGQRTATFQIKKRIWKYYGPSTLEIWSGRVGRIFLDETIEPVIKTS